MRLDGSCLWPFKIKADWLQFSPPTEPCHHARYYLCEGWQPDDAYVYSSELLQKTEARIADLEAEITRLQAELGWVPSS